MAAATDTHAGTAPARIAGRPAAIASARASRAGLTLGCLGIAASLFVVVRVADAWRVAPARSPHEISIFGQRFTYPSANVDALVVLVLAVLGLAVVVRVVVEAIREVRLATRIERRLSAHAAERPDGVRLIDDDWPRAFCCGLRRPRIYLSTGAVRMLDGAALEAVIEHERHHLRRRDPLRFAVGRVLARALFFVPGLDELVRRHRELAELSADETAIVASARNRAGLARAMLAFADAGAPGNAAGVEPARADYVLGTAPNWRLPAVLCVAGAATIALVVAVALLVGRVAAGSATLALPILSRRPCVVVLATIPVALGLLALILRRRVSGGVA